MSYQPEERYWTDYLRIALPVVGLILMLGLFWFWADALINDGDDEQPTVTPEVTLTIANEPPTPTSTLSVVVTPNETTRVPTVAGGTNGEETPSDLDDTPTEAPTEDPGGDEAVTFAEGDAVTVIDDGVNLRADASTEAEVVRELSEGTELVITGDSEADAEVDRTWWPVEDPVTEETGWVAEEFIQAAGE